MQFGSNPYRDGRLKLECVVSGPRDARFSLGWRHRSSMAAEVTKLKGTSRGTRRDSVQSSHLIFDPLLPNPSRVGHYWCVVFADGNEVASSESVVLLPPEAYADDVHPISATLHPYQRQATPPTNSTQGKLKQMLRGKKKIILLCLQLARSLAMILSKVRYTQYWPWWWCSVE